MEVISPSYTLQELAGLRAAHIQNFMKFVSLTKSSLGAATGPGALPALLGPDHRLATAAVEQALPWRFNSR